MNKIILTCLILFMIFISLFSNEPFSNLTGLSKLGSILPDSQSFSISTGMMTTMNRTYTYSLMSSNFTQKLSPNWKLNYGLSYLNYNMRDNFVIGGLGLTYTSDKFMFNIQVDKSFDANAITNNSLTGF